MVDELYLETDEEVTSAVEKIKKSKKKKIVLCLPRNAMLGQSIVNLKLIFKEAAAEGKEIGLVSPDKTTRSLAERIGFSVFETTKDIDFPKDTDKPKKAAEKPKEEPEDETAAEETDDADAADEASDEDSESEDDDAPATPSGLRSAGFTSQSLASKQADDEQDDQADEDENEPDEKPEPRPSRQAAASGSMIPTKGNLRFFRQKKRRSWWIPVVALVLVLGGSGLAAAMYVPSATVKISIAAQPLNETLKTVVDTEATEVNVDTATLPGKLLTIQHETKSSTKATGKKDIGEKATGNVTLINEWDSLTHTFTEGTKITAKNGREFVLAADVTVPGAVSTISNGKVVITAGKKEVAVTAAAAGTEYNVSATTFAIPSLPKAQQEKIYGTSSASFTGGTSNVVTVVTQADLDKISETLKTQNKEEAVAKLKEQAADQVILDKALQTASQELKSSVPVETQAESVEATVTGSFSVIAFSTEHHKQLLEKLMENKIPQGQKLVTEGDGVTVDTSQFELNLVSDKRLELTNTLQAFTVNFFDEAAVKRSLIGASPSDVQSLVQKRIATATTETSLSPAGWPRLPLSGRRITLQFNYTAKQDE